MLVHYASPAALICSLPTAKMFGPRTVPAICACNVFSPCLLLNCLHSGARLDLTMAGMDLPNGSVAARAAMADRGSVAMVMAMVGVVAAAAQLLKLESHWSRVAGKVYAALISN